MFNSKVENEDKWITIKPNGEENKGKHLLVKDGETPKEAIDRVYKKEDKKDNFEKETKTTKKDEDKHQKVRELEDKAYKEFKKTYDNYIQGEVKISDFSKAKEQFNKKYKGAFDKLESDRFISFEDFAKRENKQSDTKDKQPDEEYEIELDKKDWEYIATQPQEKQQAIIDALKSKKQAEIEGEKIRQKLIEEENKKLRENKIKKDKEITEKYGESEKKRKEDATKMSFEEYFKTHYPQYKLSKRSPVYELAKGEWEQAQNSLTDTILNAIAELIMGE